MKTRRRVTTERKSRGLRERDPHHARESQRYETPIPSREFILSTLEEAGVPVNETRLVRLLDPAIFEDPPAQTVQRMGVVFERCFGESGDLVKSGDTELLQLNGQLRSDAADGSQIVRNRGPIRQCGFELL